MSNTVAPVDTTSVETTATGSDSPESGSVGLRPSSRLSRSAAVPRTATMSGETTSSSTGSESPAHADGSTRATRSRNTRSSTPPDPGPPSFDVEAEAEELLGDKKKLFSVLKKELLVAYLLEVRAGKDQTANPQHSRASRKQAKELAELLARLTNETEK